MDEVGSSDDEDYVPSEEGNGSEHDEISDQEFDVEEHAQPSSSAEQSNKDDRNSQGTTESADERKCRLDALFDDFIGASSSSMKDSLSNEPNCSAVSSDLKREEAVETGTNITTTEAKAVMEIFDFAGEEVRIERTLPKSDHKECAPVEASISKNKRNAVGLGDAVKKLSKKPKMSVLEKTQHDWTTFKAESGIHDELQSHNRGRQGYVERMAFLNRADLRQFEREREARNAKRAKK
uniref:Craniofacial development protein 1 n=1 Tax=Parascaris univalens TaxID=6257 RepID=A0A914ZN35_PARUN